MFIVVASLSSAVGETTRPTTLGVSLAYPTAGYVGVSRDLSAGLFYELRVPVTLDIDPEGKVTNVREGFADDTLIVRGLDSVLKSLAFAPGLKNGLPVGQKIQADLFLYPGRRSAALRTPVSDSLTVEDAGSYAQALLANGAAIPSIKRLAPYFCTLSNTESPSVLPSILLKIALTESGKPSSIDPLRSGYPSITDQIVSVFNWADYIPTGAPGRPVVSEIFVSVVFHPAALYPTRPIGNTGHDTASIVEQFLLQVYPDTLGLMVPPLPRRLQYDSLVLPEALNRQYGRICLRLIIDTAGKTEIGRISASSRQIYDLTNRVLARVLFYPALSFNGQPRPFVGLAYIDFDGSTNVRIHLDWMTRRSEPPVR